MVVGIEPTVEGIEPTHTGENEVVEDHLFSRELRSVLPITELHGSEPLP